jgi:hypothetical protein
MTRPTFDNPSMHSGIERSFARIGRPLVALALLAFAAGCVLFQHPQGISVSSDPPGATVLIGGHDTGFVTPCVLDVDPSDDTRVDIVLQGHETETRYISTDHEIYVILWREMSVGFDTWDFPLFLNFRDFFVPIKFHERVTPGRIHVKLDRSADKTVPSTQ